MNKTGSQKFKSYNTHNRVNIKVNDAVKVTSEPQYESFWVEVRSVNEETKEITGSVENILQRRHRFNHTDIISFYKKNIKEYKKEEDRFNLDKIDSNAINNILAAAVLNMSLEDFEKFINTKNIS